MWRRCAAAIIGIVICGMNPCAGGSGDKIHVVLIDGQNNHNWRETTPVMKKALEETGLFTVDVATSPEKALADWRIDFDKYQVVVSNYNGQPWPQAINKSLDEHLNQGKLGLVIVHAANNSFGGWKEYNRMIGMGWRDNSFGDRLTIDASGNEVRVPKGKGPGAGHGAYHAFRVTVRDPNHPITKDMPHEWMHDGDELYHGMRGPAENVHLLATAYDDKKFGGTGENEPMIWTVTYGKGRVFHTPMGHDRNSMLCVGFQTTLTRGSQWAATGKVTQPLPANFPTPGKVSTIRAK